jgi:hypothetical protein
MIQSVQELPLTLTNNTSAITFTNDTIRSRSACQNNCNGWLCHNEGNPLYQVVQGGYYEVDFNANISSATAGSVAFGLFQDGVLIPGTTVTTDIATAGVPENVSFEKVIQVCCRTNANLTIASVPSVPNLSTGVAIETETPIIQSANLIIKKLS